MGDQLSACVLNVKLYSELRKLEQIQSWSQLIFSGTAMHSYHLGGGSPQVRFNVIDSISIWYDLGTNTEWWYGHGCTSRRPVA